MEQLVKKLKSLYGDAVVTGSHHQNDYDWYTTPQNETFGIQKNTLSHKEKDLLEALVATAPQPSESPGSTSAYYWKTYLEENDSISKKAVMNLLKSDHAHLLFFAFGKPLDDPQSLEDLIMAFTDAPTTFILQDEKCGYAVIEGKIDSDYQDFIALAAADLFLTVKLMVVPEATIHDLPDYFTAGKQLFEKALSHYNQRAYFHYYDLLPLGLIANLSQECLFTPFQEIEKALDEDTIKTLLVFFEHHLNVTNASKALFIHRNSLQYRLDKFQEKCDLDPKSFNDAAIIKLLIEAGRFRKLSHPAQ